MNRRKTKKKEQVNENRKARSVKWQYKKERFHGPETVTRSRSGVLAKSRVPKCSALKQRIGG